MTGVPVGLPSRRRAADVDGVVRAAVAAARHEPAGAGHPRRLRLPRLVPRRAELARGDPPSR